MAQYSRTSGRRHRGAADARHPALHSPAARRCPPVRTEPTCADRAQDGRTDRHREEPGHTTVTVPVHPDVRRELRAARKRSSDGRGVHRQARERPRAADEQEGLGGQFKKYAVLAASTSQRRAAMACARRAPRVAAYADCTEAQMMAMFGWSDHKMPALYIAKASRDKLAISGMDKVVAFDQSGLSGDFAANETGTDTLSLNSPIRKRSQNSCYGTSKPTADVQVGRPR